MTNAAHTLAPWGMDHYADHVSYFSPARKDDYAFRVEFPDDMPEAEAEAYARLIAAAPELLKALQDAQSFLREYPANTLGADQQGVELRISTAITNAIVG